MTGDRITWLWSNEAERFVRIEERAGREPIGRESPFDRTVR